VKRGKFQKSKSKHMNPAAESWVLKAIFALILSILLLLGRDSVAGFLSWALGLSLSGDDMVIPALLIFFGSIATIGGMFFAFKTELGDWLRGVL